MQTLINKSINFEKLSWEKLSTRRDCSEITFAIFPYFSQPTYLKVCIFVLEVCNFQRFLTTHLPINANIICEPPPMLKYDNIINVSKINYNRNILGGCYR